MRVTVLLVDDKLTDLGFYSAEILNAGPYEVQQASSAAVATGVLERDRTIRVAVIDMRMPDEKGQLDFAAGMRVLRFIRKERLPVVPIVLTGFAMNMQEIRECRDLGVAAVIRKEAKSATELLIAEVNRTKDAFCSRLLGLPCDFVVADMLWRGEIDASVAESSLEAVHLVVLAGDIRGSSKLVDDALAGNLQLQLAEFLAEWNTMMQEVVNAYGGVVTQFTGDGFRALFGLPDIKKAPEVPGKLRSAVCCALGLQAAFKSLLQAYKSRPWLVGCRPDIGVAVNYGAMLFGNLGSRRFKCLTVLGRAINDCARMEKFARTGASGTDGAILVPQELFRENLAPYVRRVNKLVHVTGHGSDLPAYRVVDMEKACQQEGCILRESSKRPCSDRLAAVKKIVGKHAR